MRHGLREEEVKETLLESSAIKNLAPTRKQRHGIPLIVRANEWWEFKLAPVFATAYATTFILKISILSLWPQLLMALLALTACAAYASVINDLTDLEDDLASGKVNRLAGTSRVFGAAALACCIVPGVIVAIYWRDDPLLLSLYLASWAAFTLYSLPPVRLKERGVFGLLADACGAHLFPTLFAAAIVYRSQGGPADAVWLASVAAWSLSFGLRGILWHQLSDLHNDEKINLNTFARRHKVAWLHGLGNFTIFPAEVAAFCFMLWHAGSFLAVALLGYYALFTFLRKRVWGVNLVVVAPKAKSYILMQEYYEVFFPLAFLLSSSKTYPLDALIIVPHLLLFPRRAVQSVKDMEVFLTALKLIIKRIRG
jgi:4-hydroxybenzoate polyprenyltransferase